MLVHNFFLRMEDDTEISSFFIANRRRYWPIICFYCEPKTALTHHQFLLRVEDGIDISSVFIASGKIKEREL